MPKDWEEGSFADGTFLSIHISLQANTRKEAIHALPTRGCKWRWPCSPIDRSCPALPGDMSRGGTRPLPLHCGDWWNPADPPHPVPSKGQQRGSCTDCWGEVLSTTSSLCQATARRQYLIPSCLGSGGKVMGRRKLQEGFSRSVYEFLGALPHLSLQSSPCMKLTRISTAKALRYKLWYRILSTFQSSLWVAHKLGRLE